MGKKLLVLVSLLVMGFSPALAYAQDATTTNTVTAAETSNATVTPTANNTGLGLRKSTTSAIKDAQAEVKDKMLQAREEYKQKLAAIKDQRKQAIVANLDSRIANINNNRTTQMSERLDRLTGVLGRISTKAATLKSEGKNTATLDADIAKAQNAIDAAKQAVTAQAAKIYTINITTDAGLKGAVSSTIQQFMTDIKAVHAKVVAAQLTVVKSYKDVASLMGVTPTPTTAAAVTPTTQP